MPWRADNFDLKAPAWLKSLGGIARDVVDFCYPGVCPICRDCCDGADFCPACEKQMSALESAPACLMCGVSLAYLNAPCPACAGRGVPHYDRVIRLAKFADPLRPLIHQVKFHGAWNVGELLADRLLAQDSVDSLLLDADCLLPVPLHAMRRFVRGYNQAEIIARRLSRKRDIPVVEAVRRRRNTQPQTDLPTPARRMANLKGAFELFDPDKIEGRRVVVIDDVMTSGATLRMFARAIKPARPKSLSALLVAVAEQKGSRGA